MHLWEQRISFFPSDSRGAVWRALRAYVYHKRERGRVLYRSREISRTSFDDTFRELSDSECLRLFRFQKGDVLRMVSTVGWPFERCRTRRNRYESSSLLSTCILLCRLSTPLRWHDVETRFGKHCSQLSEIFW